HPHLKVTLTPYTTLFRSNSEMSPEVQGYHNKTRFSTYSRVFEDYFTVPMNIKSVSFRGNIFETGVLQNTVGKIDFTQGNSFSALDRKSTRLNSSHVSISY